MKTKFLIVLMCLFAASMTYSQRGFKNNGAKVIVGTGGIVNITGGTSGDFINATSGTSHGRIDLNGKIKLEGDWTNNATSGSVFINLGTDGEVQFLGTNAHSISGNTTSFEKFTLNTTGNTSLSTSTSVNGNLSLTNGLLVLGANNLTLGTSSSIVGTPSASKMVVASSTGELRKLMTGTGSFTFPIGDNTGTIEYSPITLNFTSGTFNANAYASARVTNAKHPQNTSTTGYISRYWNLGQSNITSYSCSVTGTYTDADIFGTETLLFSGYYNTPNWIKIAAVNAASNQIGGTFSTFYPITAGDQAMFCSSTITVDEVITNVSCNGGNNASINITVTGGVSPYTYNWTTVGGSGVSATAEDQTGLTAGTYYVTVTDINGCTQTDIFTITQPSVLSASSTQTNVTCNAGTNGAIDVTVSGGTAPYTYNWGGGITTEDRTGIAAGTYTITVTDNKGCQTTKSVTITQPSAITVSMTRTNVTCYAGSNGTATATVSGGVPSYTYNWNDASFQTTATANNLVAGTYTVTVKDANMCQNSASITITQPTQIVLTTSSTIAGCNMSNGSATVSASGGGGSYTYDWSPNGYTGDGTATYSALPAGTYSVSVYDASLCLATSSVTVSQVANPIASIGSQTNVSCNGGSNGAATVSVSGGTTPYVYTWSTSPAQTTLTASNLISGTYTVTVVDNNGAGCSTTASVTITQPTVLNSSITTSTNVSCNGGSNGTATVSASGGAGSYTYTWSTTPAQTAATATGLSAGTYSVTVKDANNCTKTSSVTITEPTLLTANIVGTNVSCNGGSNGIADLTVSGGTAPYSYNWGGGITTQDRNGLSAGTYTVTVTDNKSCTISKSVTITEPSAISLTINKTNVSCYGGSNGTATAVVSGGVSPYTYQWDDAGFQTTQVATGLTVGTYGLIITDNNSCTKTGSVTITEPTEIVLTTSSTQSICGGSTGSATVSASGGTSPYAYLWNTTPAQITATASNIPAGSYSVTVTDLNSCTKNSVIAVSELNAPIATISSQTNVSCNGGSNGAATVSVIGGTTPYVYTWSTSPAQTTSTASNLISGTYTVTVIDNNGAGCSTTASVTITQPAVLNASITSSTNVSCYGGNNGTATVSANGGTGALTYSWSTTPVQTTATATGLSAGTYSVTVVDINNCTKVASVTIVEPTQISSSFVQTNVSCNGASDGSVDLTVSGGTVPYVYNWSNSSNNQDLLAINAGTYSVSITDANNCIANNSVTITEPVLLTSSNVSSNVSCYGGNNASIDVTVNGGTSPYIYLWNDGTATEDRTGLTAGVYTLSITDNNNCVITNNITISEPSEILISSNIQDVSCYGLTDGSIDISVSGGTTPFSYLWNNNEITQDLTGLSIGTYGITVTDNNNCINNVSIEISQPEQIATEILSFNASCGLNNGEAIVSVLSGGIAPFSYLWSEGTVLSNVENLGDGTYYVTVTDNNLCSVVDSVEITITYPPVLTLLSKVDLNCYNICNGSASIDISGGLAPYSILWNDANNQTSAIASNLCAGAYTVTVTDANNCTETYTVNINQPSEIIVNLVSQENLSCYGDNNGTINISASGGTGNLSYLWNDQSASTTTSIANLISGSYTVTISDENSCIKTSSYIITSPQELIALETITNVNCNGGNNASIDLNISGGVSPYTFNWNSGQSTEDINSLTAGVYDVTITDFNNCTLTDSYTINEPSSLDVTITTIDVKCFGGNDGSAIATVSGGMLPVSYLWSNNQTTQTATGLTAGTYSLTVIDANSCEATNSVTIFEPLSLILSITGSDVTCNGLMNGDAVSSVSGGVTPYSYNWSNSLNTPSITGIGAGNYSLTVTDANNCSVNSNIIISQPTILEATYVVTNENLGNDGAIDLTVSGGSVPYTYLWSNAETTEDIINLSTGFYNVTITDANNCEVVKNILVGNDGCNLIVSYDNIDVNCFGGSNGELTVNVSNGTSPYTYNWSNSQTSQTITGLSAGNYVVTITDNAGCIIVSNEAILQPDQLLISYSDNSVSCYGLNDGFIDVTINGGIIPYTYLWSNNETTEDLNNIVAGTYTLSVTDANLCEEFVIVLIQEPQEIVLSASITNDTGASNGGINMTVSGGTSPYSYNWSNLETTEDILNLSSGTYDVTVTDFNGCTSTASYVVNNIVCNLTATTIITNVSCYNGNNGEATITVSGGTSPYTYLWSDSQTTQVATSLVAGVYTVTVEDADNCIIVEIITITEPSQINVSALKENVSCYGLSDGQIELSVTGGTSPYTFIWSNLETTQSIYNLSSGYYEGTLTDANGCQLIGGDTIYQPDTISYNFVESNNLCFGGNVGEIDLTVIGGTSPFNFIWSNASTSEDISGLSAGNYTVTITDSNLCQIVASTSISENSEIITTAVITDETNGNDGGIDLTVSGGISGYTFMWSNSEITEDILNVTSGIYYVTVTDSNGCSNEFSFVVSNTACDLAINITGTNLTCFESGDGEASVTISGGTSPYSIAWNNSANTENISNLDAGVYSVTVSDAGVCIESAMIAITQPSEIILTLSSTPDDNGSANGTATVVVNGGISPYTYLWSDALSQTTATAIDLGANLYSVTVTDNNGCNVSDTIRVYLVISIDNLLSEFNVSLYPVPAVNEISLLINSNKHQNSTISILNVLGEVVENFNKEIKTGNNLYKFDISNYPNGIYFVNIVNNGLNKNIKFVKESK